MPSDVRASKTFSGGTNYGATGSLAEVAGGNTITPGTAAIQAIAAGTIANAAIQVAGDPNLVAANILSGKSIFGVAGSVVEGTPYASGTALSGSASIAFVEDGGATTSVYPITVSGLSFQASRIIVILPASPYGEQVFDITDQLGINANTHYVGIYNATVYKFQTSTNLYINATGFQLPVAVPSTTFKWYAYQY